MPEVITVTEEHDPDAVQVTIDLDAYLARIGYKGGLRATLETLDGLHFAHSTGIPFENLDILLGRTISLDLDGLQAKLVAGHRGGYCFEHNTLFAAVLESLGFKVTRLAARVRLGTTLVRPRSHMLLSVEVDGEPWLADVGFGCQGTLHPVPMLRSEPVSQSASTFRVRQEGEVFILQSPESDGGFDLYAFTLERQFPVDYFVANHYTSTHPHSPFVQTLVVQRQSAHARWTLRNRELTENKSGQKTIETLRDDSALLAALAALFDLHFPAGTHFRYVRDESQSLQL
jgi:N-hydroxyarylamine O-acetyltransferase